MRHLIIVSTVIATTALLVTSTPMRAGVTAVDVPAIGLNGDINGAEVFPLDSPWNTPVDKEAVDPASAAIIARMGADKPLIPEFGSNQHGVPFGIPYVVVGQSQHPMPIVFDDDRQSDQGSYPIPVGVPMEVRNGSTTGRLIVLNRDEHRLYEVTDAYRETNGWHAV